MSTRRAEPSGGRPSVAAKSAGNQSVSSAPVTDGLTAGFDAPSAGLDALAAGPLHAAGADRLQRTYGNQTLARRAAATATSAPPRPNRSGDLTLIVAHTRASTAEPTDAHVGQRLARRSGAPVVQRFVMTGKQWEELSARVGKSRSVDLLRIDEALENYNAAANKPPVERIDLLVKLRAAIATWKQGKPVDAAGGIKSGRAAAVQQLEDAARDEVIRLGSQLMTQKKPTGAPDVLRAAGEIYERAIHELHHFLAKALNQKNADAVLGKWKVFRLEAQSLHHAAQALLVQPQQGAQPAQPAQDSEATNAVIAAQGLREGMRAFRTIAYRYLHAKRDDTKMSPRSRRKVDLGQIRARLKSTIGDVVLGASNTDAVMEFLTAVKADIDVFGAMAGADKAGAQQGKGKLAEIEGDSSEDWALIEEVINANDTLTNLLGGHAATGNEGIAEYYTPAPSSGPDTRSGGQKFFADLFSNLDPGKNMSGASPEAQRQMTANRDYLLGSADLVSSIGGLGAEALTIYKAVKVLKDPKASDVEKAKARMTLITLGLPTVMNTYKAAGAIMTLMRGSNMEKTGEGGMGKSGFGFTASGTDASTDVKMIGDFAGAFAGIISTISQVIDYFKWASDAASDPKAGRGGARKNLEFLGNALTKSTGIVSSLAGNTRALMKLGYQIAEGGQATSAGAATMSQLGGVVPGLQLVTSILQAIQQAYKLVRLGIRRGQLTDMIGTLLQGKANADLRRVEAVEIAHESLIKRMHRVGINLGHALAAIVGGALSLSGFGSSAGLAITLASSATKIGQIGLRKGKQYGRDRSAKAHDKQGDTQTYKQWKRSRQLSAHEEGKWSRFKTAIEIKFTFNWDKSGENKGSTTREVALEILRMDDDAIFVALGVLDAIRERKQGKPKSADDKLEIIVKALTKRD